MIAQLRHGLVLGAALGALLLGCEILLHGAPRQDTAEAAGWMPAYVAMGAACGALAVLTGRISSSRRARERAQGVQVFATTLALGAICFGWMPYWLSGAEGLALRAVLAFGLAAGIHLLGIATAASRRAWMLNSFTAPLSAILSLLLLCLAALGARFLLPHGSEPGSADHSAANLEESGPPNLLLVVLEGVRADRLGCYGAFRAATPQLDALAQEAVLFEQAFATSSEHDQAWTGLLGGATLAEGLAQRGHQTWAGGEAGAAAFSAFSEREDARQPRLAARLLLAHLVAAARGVSLDAESSGDDELVERALAWLRSRDGAQAFGMVLHLSETGPPYDPPRDLRNRFRPDDVGDARFDELRLAQNDEWFRRAESGERVASAEEAASMSALQDAELLATDARIERLVAGLRADGLLEQTLLIVTSDHGCRFGEEGGRLGHSGSAHDAALHVPLLVRMPRSFPAATRARGLVSLADLTPGVLAALSGNASSLLARAAAGELPRDCVIATARISGSERLVLRSAREKFLLGAEDAVLAAGDLLAEPGEEFLRRPWVPQPTLRREIQDRVRALLRRAPESAGGGGGKDG